MIRPYVLVNVAMTADGKIDTAARKGAAISSTEDLARVDRLRWHADAVMVGGHTLLAEDPRLTIKSAELRLERTTRGLPENPHKVGVVSQANLKLDGRFMTAGPARRLIYTTRRTSPDQVANLQAVGAEVFVLGKEQVDLAAVIASLGDLGVRRLMVEGGGTLIAGLFALDLVDELQVYIAPLIYGGSSAPTLADGAGFNPDQAPRLRVEGVEQFDARGGILARYRIDRS